MARTEESFSGTLIRDVTRSLQSLLEAKVTNAQESQIVFDSPGQMTDDEEKKLSLFLLKCAPCPETSNQMRQILNSTQLRQASMPLELIYMITPYGKNRETEMGILERVLRCFHDHGVLAEEYLQGEAKKQEEAIRITEFPTSWTEINNIWQIFPSKNFRPSLFYRVRPVYLPSGLVDTYVAVEERNISAVSKKRAVDTA